jgi:hypothetical protein
MYDDHVRSLCAAARLLFRPFAAQRPKWVVLHGQPTVQTVVDLELSRKAVYSGAAAAIKEHPTFRALVDRMASDDVFAQGEALAGSWARPDTLVERTLRESLVNVDSEPAVDVDRALAGIRDFRAMLDADTATFRASSRLLGVRMWGDELRLSDSLLIRRLNDEELTARQRFLDDLATRFFDPTPYDMSEHTVEVRATITVPLGKGVRPFIDAESAAFNQAADAFKRLIAAIRLTYPGHIGLAPIDLIAPLTGGGTIHLEPYARPAIPLPDAHANPAILGHGDEAALRRLLDRVHQAGSEDRVLSTALARFMLATQRYDVLDKLVDLAIAWESLLLTVNGNPVMTESAYRFSLNGSSVLHACGAEPDRGTGLEVMKAAYAARSKIVHGGDDHSMRKASTSSRTHGPEELAWLLERHFRDAARWLLNLDAADRPYRAAAGWERLLWD